MRKPVACATIILAALHIISPADAQAPPSNWRIELTTQQGPCEKTFRAEFAIRKDDIVTATGSAFSASGSVERNGEMWVRLKNGRDNYNVHGKLRKRGGSGAWSSNTRLCGGIWRGKPQ